MSKEAGLSSLYRDQATDWTVESSWFDSRKEKDVSLLQSVKTLCQAYWWCFPLV
jgi:hypothetical protein